jgi:hypothetical protein
MDNRKHIKTFERFITNKELMFNLVDTDYNSINSILSKKYEQILFNNLLMEDVVGDDYLLESLEDVVLKIHASEWETNPNEFYNSFMSSDRIGFLTPYTVDELKEFSLYKVNGYKIGFAVKKDGDIILVHNNEPYVKNIGKLLLNKAIKNGGIKLDHFDGFLTGFYKSVGFNFNSNDYFLDEYAPETWEYKAIDIENPKQSIYANELIVDEESLITAKTRYDSGRPDIVYRKLK